MAGSLRKRPSASPPPRRFAGLRALEGPLDPEPNGRFPSFAGAGLASGPSSAPPPPAGRGGGSKLRAGAENGEGAWSRFRQGSGGENEHPGPEQVNAPRGGARRGAVHFLAASGHWASAGELLERPDQVLVGGVRVDRRRRDRLVPASTLAAATTAPSSPSSRRWAGASCAGCSAATIACPSPSRRPTSRGC